jgi:hypothetical protein
MKIYVVEADLTGTDSVQKRNTLGRSIGALAKGVNEPVFFHDFKDPAGGAPVILLECSDAFLKIVEQLPECAKTYEIWPNTATERSSKLWDYFTATPPNSSPRRGLNP